jgi:hypothetical protein
MARIINSADKIIDQLGGTGAVSRKLGVSQQTAWNWRERGFPWHRYPEIRTLLRRERLKFSREIFAHNGRSLPPTRSGGKP